MKLANFEEFIEDVILKRGKDYYERGLIEDIIQVKEGHYSAVAYGTDLYHVKAIVGAGGKILDSECDCPYDFSEFCKHKAALFYALSENMPNLNQNTNRKQESLESVLAGLKKEKLVELILTISENDSRVEKQILMKYGSNKDEIKTSKSLIKEYINGEKSRGFIAWNRTADAIVGAEMVVQKAITYLENHDPKMAVNLSLITLSEMIGLTQYCDDSSGYVGDVIYTCLNLISDSMAEAVHLPHSEQLEIYNTVMKEAKHNRYEGWSDWKNDLLSACVTLCENPAIREKLEKELQKMLDSINGESWGADYEREELKLIQLRILEQFSTDAEADQFILQNIANHRFREKAVSKLLNAQKFAEVIDLCSEGEQIDANLPGIVHRWKEYRYQAYEGQGEIEKQKELGKELLIKGEFDYFHKLKSLFSILEWETALTDILSTFEKNKQSPTYVKILIEEKQTEKLLNYCKEETYEIERLYPYLVDQYLNDVTSIFRKHIGRIAERSSNRNEYKKVCKVIKTFKKACGSQAADQIVKELQVKFLKRPAFLDELGKIK